MTVAFMLGCWALCLAAGRLIGGPEHGPILGIVMVMAWHVGMIVLAPRKNGKDVVG